MQSNKNIKITITTKDFTKYAVDETKRKRFPEPMFSVVHIVNTEEVEKFRKRNGRLPEHVYERNALGGQEDDKTVTVGR